MYKVNNRYPVLELENKQKPECDGARLQGRIYIGASGSMAPGPEMPGGSFESLKNSETYFIKLEWVPVHRLSFWASGQCPYAKLKSAEFAAKPLFGMGLRGFQFPPRGAQLYVHGPRAQACLNPALQG